VRVAHLKVACFRNIESASLDFSHKVNIVFGANGQGKTSLVEAIAFLSSLRSFRTPRTGDLVMEGKEASSICATIEKDGVSRVIEVVIGKGFRKVAIDGHPVKSASQCLDLFKVVATSPDDSAVLDGGPDGRRLLLDRFCSLLDPQFIMVSKKYEMALKERNEALRTEGFSPDALDAIEQALSRASAEVLRHRLKAIDELGAKIVPILGSLGGEALEVQVSYEASWLKGENYEDAMLRSLVANRKKDQALGYTQFGPHSDDIRVNILGFSARGRASRGQRKLLILAWKFAEAALIIEKLGEIPVLILDDCMSDLDNEKASRLLLCIEESPYQCFITGVEKVNMKATFFEAIKGAFFLRE
jgi:DNA replication and repair protein RecF